MIIKNTFLLIFTFLIQLSFSQVFVNGNFENNSAGTSDQINLSNADCNLKLSAVNAFGTEGNVDIIKSATYGGSGAKTGIWYIGITGGGTDIVALTLSAPLVEGKAYTISFFDRKIAAHSVSPIQIGLSTTNNNFGTMVYTFSELASLNIWTKRTFTFVAPNNGQYITVQMRSGGINDWVNLDDFILNNNRCAGALKLVSSADSVNKGNSATLKAEGGLTYTWSPAETLSALSGSIVKATPIENTIYTVTSDQKDCGILTATVLVGIIKPKQEIIKDSIIKKKDEIVEDKTDTINVKHHKRSFNKRRVNGRKFIIQESITVGGSSIKIMVWDKNRADGDEVSLYLNGELIVENFTVTKTKKEFIINLEPGKNIIVMHALNLGLVPPNTAALSINDGTKKAKLITLVSNLKKSGALEVFYDPLAFNKGSGF